MTRRCMMTKLVELCVAHLPLFYLITSAVHGMLFSASLLLVGRSHRPEPGDVVFR